MRIERASRAERDAYEGDKPLHGYAHVHGHRIAIERLNEKKNNPQYEAIAPEGHHFDNGDHLHTLLGFDHADLIERLKIASISRCGEDCASE